VGKGKGVQKWQQELRTGSSQEKNMQGGEGAIKKVTGQRGGGMDLGRTGWAWTWDRTQAAWRDIPCMRSEILREVGGQEKNYVNKEERTPIGLGNGLESLKKASRVSQQKKRIMRKKVIVAEGEDTGKVPYVLSRDGGKNAALPPKRAFGDKKILN